MRSRELHSDHADVRLQCSFVHCRLCTNIKCGCVFVFFEQEPCEDDAIAPDASVLWRWLERCLGSSSAPDSALLRDAVPEQKDRMRILAVLGDKTMGQVEGFHLTLASLDARVVDATLPLLATFDEVQQLLPSKAVMDSVDLLDLPGYFASIGVENLLRHQVVALLSCVLLSVSEERRLGWCRLVGFTIDSDMLEVAGRLWDVHTLKAPCEWDGSGGYEDRENVVEVGGCQNYCMVGWCLFFSCLAGSRWCCLQVVLGILWGTKAFVVDDGGEVRRRRGKLDAADATYLRCLMRRYGWEKMTRRWRCVIGRNAFHLRAMGTRSVCTLNGFCSRGYCILATRLHCKLCGHFTIH